MMFPSRKWGKRLFACLALLLASSSAHPCGPNFPRGYVWRETGERMLEMPRFPFDEAINALVGFSMPEVKVAKPEHYPAWSLTLRGDHLDLLEALEGNLRRTATPGEIAEQYVALRAQMKKAFYKVERRRFLYEALRPEQIPPSTADYTPAPFDFTAYDGLMQALPPGFGDCLPGESPAQLLNVAQERADVDALARAVHDTGVDPATELDLVLRYQKFRRVLRFHTYMTLHPVPEAMDREAFALADYVPLLAELPDEFSLYVVGAWHYRCGYYEEAIKRFQELLALPAQIRPYRSVWAAYMLGVSWTHLDTKAAIPWFEKTRELAGQGFFDSTNLAEASLDKQVLSEKYEGRFAFAMDHYLGVIKSPIFDGDYHAYDALGKVCRATLEADPIPAYMYRNPEFLEVLSRWVLANRRGWDSANLLAGIRAAKLESPPPGLGRFACAAYQKGLMEQAADWVAASQPKDPHALWIGAKLAQREGKVKTAAWLLAKVDAQLTDLSGPAAVGADDFTGKTHRDVLGDLGVAKLNVRDYTGALDAFARGGHREDAAYVAERVLSTGELARFVTRHGDEPAYSATVGVYGERQTMMAQLSFTLARRYAREGKIDKAMNYYPEGIRDPKRASRWDREKSVRLLLRDEAAALQELLDTGRDRKRPAEERANALMAAARITREYGMELYGTDYVPDMYLFRGYHELPMTKRLDSEWASANETWRVKTHAPKIDHRFHYRSKAAELMWEGAKLLPDNDPRTAEALWTAGTWLARREPQAADKYYKALVNRCRKLPIGQAADKKRWFPKEFDPALQIAS